MDFEDDLRRLEPFIGREKAMRLWRVHQFEDADGRRDMEAAVQMRIERTLGVSPLSPNQCLSLPLPDQAAGDFTIGTVVGGDRLMHPFGLREDEIIQHVAIFGRSGAGKTNTVALLLKELYRHGRPFMIFDWKRNYRDLLAGDDPVPMEVYTVGRPVHPLRFNPLIPPPGTDIKTWLKKLTEIISHAYYLGEGVIFMLLEALDHLYQTFGCYNDPAARYPCMSDVLKHLQELPVKGRRAMWMDSTLRAVQSLCFGQISDVINVASSDSIADLLDINVCLELNALGHSEKIFLIETLMVWIHHCRLLEPDREHFKHCLIIEEAHNILSATAKETVVDLLLREIRELGEAIVLVDQHPSQISVPAMGNTYCTIALNMKHSKDISSLAEMMNVPRDDRDLFGQLPIGHAVVKLQSRFTRPFEIRVPKVAIAKGFVTDTDLLQLYPADSGVSQADAVAESASTPTEEIPSGRREGGSQNREYSGLNEVEQMLLKDIYDCPMDGVVRRYSRLGLSRRRGNHAKEALIAKGLVQTVDIPTRTGKVVLLEIVPTIREQLRERGVTFPPARDGGPVHVYWKHELRRLLETDGWQVSEEYPLGNGCAVDLHAEKAGLKVAVEVETGDRGCENILKLLPAGYDWIISFATTDGVKHRTQRDFHGQPISVNHILFATPTDYEQKVRVLKR